MISQGKPKGGVIDHEILLVEQSAMVGSIIVSTARQLGLRPVRLVTNCQTAQRLLERQAFDGLIACLDDEEATLQLIQNVRNGISMSPPNTPVAITTAQCDTRLANRIKTLNVSRILLKPFKIRDLVSTIELLAGIEPG